MAQKKWSTIPENAVAEVMITFERYSLSAFDEINKDQKRKDHILAAARAIAEEEVTIANEFAADPEGGDTRKRLEKYLPEDRLKQIEEGFKPQTYQIHITKKMGVYHADFIRDGKAIRSQKKLNTCNAIESVISIQTASIVVEALLLVLQAVGITVEVSEQVIIRISEEIIPVIEASSALQTAIKALKAASSGSKWGIAKAIFNVIKASNSAGIFWQICKALCHNMSTWDWFKTAALITAMIVAAIATDGAALIAKIILALNSAYDFIKKISNLNQLEDITKEIGEIKTTPD